MWQALPASKYYQSVRLPVGYYIFLALLGLSNAIRLLAKTYRISLVPKEPMDNMP